MLILTLSIARTGRRNGKHSPKRAALKTAAHPARHKPPGFDFCPRSDVGRVVFNRKLKRVRADELLVVELLRHVCISQFVQGTTSTSQPFDVGIPVPSVSPPISLHVGGPYGTKIIPSGTLPAWHLNAASPNSVRTTAICPSASPNSAISS